MSATAHKEKGDGDLLSWFHNELKPPVARLSEHVPLDLPRESCSSLVVRPLVDIVHNAKVGTIMIDAHMHDFACGVAQCKPVNKQNDCQDLR